jgi:hypothetical protein
VARRALLIGVGALVLAALPVLLSCRGRSAAPPRPTQSEFEHQRVTVESPDLGLDVVRVSGQHGSRGTDWVCELRCREPGGCHAELRITVHYRSSAEDRTISFVGVIEAADGEQAVFGGVQRPPEMVDDVARVEVRVQQRLDPERPTPVVLD